MNMDIVHDWENKLPTLCEGYAAYNIFNIDETGLFYTKTLKTSGQVLHEPIHDKLHLRRLAKKTIEKQMRKKGRKILMFLDNALSHPHLTLTNVKLQFMPSNTTSVCQPMDQGIIQTMKLKYRKQQLQYVNNEMDKHPLKTGPEIIRDVNLLQAICWVSNAWEDTSSTTIEKCFSRCGFNMDPQDHNI